MILMASSRGKHSPHLIKICVCLYTPVSPSVPEMEGTYSTGGILFARVYLWRSLCTLYLLARQVELP